MNNAILMTNDMHSVTNVTLLHFYQDTTWLIVHERGKYELFSVIILDMQVIDRIKIATQHKKRHWLYSNSYVWHISYKITFFYRTTQQFHLYTIQYMFSVYAYCLYTAAYIYLSSFSYLLCGSLVAFFLWESSTRKLNEGV